jgi:hypothetical protein
MVAAARRPGRLDSAVSGESAASWGLRCGPGTALRAAGLRCGPGLRDGRDSCRGAALRAGTSRWAGLLPRDCAAGRDFAMGGTLAAGLRCGQRLLGAATPPRAGTPPRGGLRCGPGLCSRPESLVVRVALLRRWGANVKRRHGMGRHRCSHTSSPSTVVMLVVTDPRSRPGPRRLRSPPASVGGHIGAGSERSMDRRRAWSLAECRCRRRLSTRIGRQG